MNMNTDESARLLSLMSDAIHRSHRSRRGIERSLGLSQGYLASLFKGRIQLKVSHVYAIARELGLDPLTFFAQASSPEGTDSLVTKLAGGMKAAVPSSDPLPTRSEIEQMIRNTVRDEMERLRNQPDEKEDEEEPKPPV